MVKILALDPGDVQSGFALMTMPNFKLHEFGKVDNDFLLNGKMYDLACKSDAFAIEMIASYGMPVGKTVFDTCVWIGRFWQMYWDYKGAHLGDEPMDFIYRKDEKISICGSMKAKDANIRQALIDSYATHDFKTGKGTKANPDTFYGVAADVWQAIAVGVTWYEKFADK